MPKEKTKPTEATMPPISGDEGVWEIPYPENAQFGGPPEGTYLLRCDEAPAESLSSKQDSQFEFSFTFIDPTLPDRQGSAIKYWCSRKPKAWWNICQTLDALKVKYEINQERKVFRFNPNDCIGKQAKGVFKESEFEGRKRVKLTQIIPETAEVEDLTGNEGEAPF